jgi:Ca2+-binding EF-hand superfamily protein
LKNLLVAIGDGESNIERSRQRLCEIRDMAPASVFERIDRDGNRHISSYEIVAFLRDNNTYGVSHEECRALVNYFDSDNDGKLFQHE